MVITNIHLRLLFGFWAIFIGLVLLKIYRDRDKENIWGNFYRTANDLFQRSSAAQHNAKVYLILGWLSIAGGLIAFFYGFRLSMIGY
jgi:hypothetical protein